MLTIGRMMSFLFFIVGLSPLVQTASAATFSCSAGDAVPEGGFCYNALEIEGNLAGDFRLSSTWLSDFDFVLTVAPGFSASQFGTKESMSGGKAISSQDPANVENALAGADWFNQPLTLVGLVDSIDADNFNSNILADVFYIHAGSTVMAFLYDIPINNFSITTGGYELSNLRAYNTVMVVPLPAALPLYGAGIAILLFMVWRHKRKVAT